MPSWAEVVDHLRARYQVSRSEPGWIELLWRMQDGDRSIQQHQTVRQAEAFGALYVLVAAEIASARPLSSDDALRHNASLAIGALALEEQRLILRHGLPAEGLSLSFLERVVEVVAMEAARLAQSMQARFVPELYAAFID